MPGMFLVIPPLFLLVCLDAAAWVAGFYLLIKFFQERWERNISLQSPWVWLWGIAWPLSIVGFLSTFGDADLGNKFLNGDLYSLALLLNFGSPLLWLIALYLYRRTSSHQAVGKPSDVHNWYDP